jgi:GNAT superfamily N-acetyltransferase
MQIDEHQRGDFLITTDQSRLDVDAIHAYLVRSYWAKGIPRDTLVRGIAGSLCFGVFQGKRQIGFARAISDFATYAYLSDVFILEEFQGQGLGKWLMECVMSHPNLQGLRRWGLATRDAHGLYRQYGFQQLTFPDRMMEILHLGIYKRSGPEKHGN